VDVGFGLPAGCVAVRLSPQASRPEAEGLLEALGRVWDSEVDIDFEAHNTTFGARGVPMPISHFDRRECWIAPPARRQDTAPAGASTGGTTRSVVGRERS
jgi:acyl transferase domain-containing protein